MTPEDLSISGSTNTEMPLDLTAGSSSSGNSLRRLASDCLLQSQAFNGNAAAAAVAASVSDISLLMQQFEALRVSIVIYLLINKNNCPVFKS